MRASTPKHFVLSQYNCIVFYCCPSFFFFSFFILLLLLVVFVCLLCCCCCCLFVCFFLACLIVWLVGCFLLVVCFVFAFFFYLDYLLVLLCSSTSSQSLVLTDIEITHSPSSVPYPLLPYCAESWIKFAPYEKAVLFHQSIIIGKQGCRSLRNTRFTISLDAENSWDSTSLLFMRVHCRVDTTLQSIVGEHLTPGLDWRQLVHERCTSR